MEDLFRQLWDKFGREVSVSFVRDGRSSPRSVMVEGDVGSFGGDTIEDALRFRHVSGAPERAAGWGAEAR
jgi:hypothetical protein